MKQNFGLGGPEAPASAAGGDAGGAICSGAVAGAAVRLLPRLRVWRGCMPVAQWVDSRALKCVLGLAHLLVILMIW